MSVLTRASLHHQHTIDISPFFRKLALYKGLDKACQKQLAELFIETRDFCRRRDIVRNGREAPEVFILLSGWAAYYQILDGEERQVTSFLLPGDVFPMQGKIAGTMDHSVFALTDCRIAAASAESVQAAMFGNFKLADAFWWMMIAENNILRAWVTNISHRSAHDRIAHLLSELATRLQMIGLSDGLSFFCPLTQQELADALGLTIVHVNRMLRLLNSEGLVEWRRHQVTLLDPQRLHCFAQFHPGYLNPGSSPSAKKALEHHTSNLVQQDKSF